MKITNTLAALALLGCSASGGPEVTQVPSAEEQEPLGKSAPSLKLPDQSGAEIDLADFKGQVVIVDFWASWCGPCKDELPVLDAMYRKHSDRGLTVLAVNIDEEREDAQALLNQLKVSFPVLYDSKQEAVSEWAPPKMPTSYIIDRDGNISVVQAGFEPKEAAALEELVLSHLE